MVIESLTSSDKTKQNSEMRDVEIALYCCFCGNKFSTAVKIPALWKMHVDCLENEECFCPEHHLIQDWLDNACDGCAGCWGDCYLSDAVLKYSVMKYYLERKAANKDPDYKYLEEKDYETLEYCKCPFRTNGSFMVNNGKITSLDNQVSFPEKTEAGKFFVSAIKKYIEKYKEK